MTEIIMYLMAIGAILGGLDLIIGNRFGLGERFQEAFRLMGPIGLSMAGIICLAPLLSELLRGSVVPLCEFIKVDPGVLGSVLAIDMGGYQLAMDLAADPMIGKFSGIVVAAIFGCTVVFTIPVGLGMMGQDDRKYFTHGILLGLVVLPISVLIGGIACGLTVISIFQNFCPIFLFSALLIAGLIKFRDAMVRGFQWVAKVIQIIATLGLILGAVQYLTGIRILEDLTPIEDAVQVVGSISIAMLGSLPLAHLLQQLLKRPLAWIGQKTGMNSASMTGLLVGMVSVVPALVMIPQMDNRGKIVNGAFLVCAASAFAAHLGFAAGVQQDMVVALLIAKLFGGLLGALLALLETKNGEEAPDFVQ